MPGLLVLGSVVDRGGRRSGLGRVVLDICLSRRATAPPPGWWIAEPGELGGLPAGVDGGGVRGRVAGVRVGDGGLGVGADLLGLRPRGVDEGLPLGLRGCDVLERGESAGARRDTVSFSSSFFVSPPAPEQGAPAA